MQRGSRGSTPNQNSQQAKSKQLAHPPQLRRQGCDQLNMSPRVTRGWKNRTKEPRPIHTPKSDWTTPEGLLPQSTTEWKVTKFKVNTKRALNKKMKAANRDDACIYEEAGEGLNVTCQAGFYELVRRASCQFYASFRTAGLTSQAVIQTDQDSAIVQVTFKIKTYGGQAAYSLDLYHTNSSIRLSGRHQQKFVENDWPHISNIIQEMNDVRPTTEPETLNHSIKRCLEHILANSTKPKHSSNNKGVTAGKSKRENTFTNNPHHPEKTVTAADYITTAAAKNPLPGSNTHIDTPKASPQQNRLLTHLNSPKRCMASPQQLRWQGSDPTADISNAENETDMHGAQPGLQQLAAKTTNHSWAPCDGTTASSDQTMVYSDPAASPQQLRWRGSDPIANPIGAEAKTDLPDTQPGLQNRRQLEMEPVNCPITSSIFTASPQQLGRQGSYTKDVCPTIPVPQAGLHEAHPLPLSNTQGNHSQTLMPTNWSSTEKIENKNGEVLLLPTSNTHISANHPQVESSAQIGRSPTARHHPACQECHHMRMAMQAMEEENFTFQRKIRTQEKALTQREKDLNLKAAQHASAKTHIAALENQVRQLQETNRLLHDRLASLETPSRPNTPATTPPCATGATEDRLREMEKHLLELRLSSMEAKIETLNQKHKAEVSSNIHLSNSYTPSSQPAMTHHMAYNTPYHPTMIYNPYTGTNLYRPHHFPSAPFPYGQPHANNPHSYLHRGHQHQRQPSSTYLHREHQHQRQPPAQQRQPHPNRDTQVGTGNTTSLSEPTGRVVKPNGQVEDQNSTRDKTEPPYNYIPGVGTNISANPSTLISNAAQNMKSRSPDGRTSRMVHLDSIMEQPLHSHPQHSEDTDTHQEDITRNDE